MVEKRFRIDLTTPIKRVTFKEVLNHMIASGDQIRKMAEKYPVFIDVGETAYFVCEGINDVDLLMTSIDLAFAEFRGQS